MAFPAVRFVPFERKGHKRLRWRWIVVARNGNLVAQSAEGDGYSSRTAARRAYASARRLLHHLSG